MPSTFGRLLVLLGSVGFVVTAYNVRQERVRLHQPGLAYSPSHELVAALASSVLTLIIGVVLTAPDFKDVTWSSEMRKKSIDEVDARLGFASVRHRGHIFFGDAPSHQSIPS